VNLLIISPVDFPYGGAASRCIHMLGKGWVRLGHEVSVLVPKVRNSNTGELDGIRVISPRVSSQHIKLSHRSRLVTQGHFFLECLRYTFPTPRYDWIIIYGFSVVGGIIAPIWKLCGGKVASVSTDLFSKKQRFKEWEYIQAKLFEMIAVRSPFHFSSVFFTLSSRLERHYRKISPRKKIIRFLAPVDYAFFSHKKSLSLTQYRIKENEKLLVFSGSLHEIEGVDVLMRAFAKSLQEIKEEELKLIIASAAPTNAQLNKLKNLMDELSLKEKVEVVTSLTLPQVVDLLSQADILVMPKIDHILNHMAMPIKLGEYLASGKPVIATGVGDIGIYLKHMKTALLCKPGDPESLGECIKLLVENRELAQRIGSQGKKLAKDIFDIIPNAEKISDALSDG
jgi:glycosyltransferase involved in cell wall biosynthesis